MCLDPANRKVPEASSLVPSRLVPQAEQLYSESHDDFTKTRASFRLLFSLHATVARATTIFYGLVLTCAGSHTLFDPASRRLFIHLVCFREPIIRP